MPISPATLPYLYFSSKYIVIAKISNPEVSIGRNIAHNSCNEIIRTGKDGDGVAYLKIIEVLKGEISDTQIVVRVESFTCPAPAEYTDGKFVIAFLNKIDDENIFETTSLAWGAKEDDNLDSRINSYKLGVLQLNRISRLTQDELFQNYFLEFLISSCENSDLKWDGIYTMIRQKENPINRYDYEFFQSVNLNITTNQRKRLENVFFSSNSLTETDLYFLFVISGENKYKAANKVIRTLSKLEVSDYDLDNFIEGFLYLIPDKKLVDFYEEFDSFDSEERKQELFNEFVKKANALLSINKHNAKGINN